MRVRSDIFKELDLNLESSLRKQMQYNRYERMNELLDLSSE